MEEAKGHIERDLRRLLGRYQTSDLQEAAFGLHRGRPPRIGFDAQTGRANYEWDWDDELEQIRADYRRPCLVCMAEFKNAFNEMRRRRDEIRRAAGLVTPYRVGLDGTAPQANSGNRHNTGASEESHGRETSAANR